MRLLKIIVLPLIAAVLVGCGPTGAPPPSHHAVADESFNAVWDAATEVLREYRFTIDRADRRAGIITTFPMVGRHWFEFWRKDAATPRDVAEGTLQTIHRQVTVNIRPAESAGTDKQGGYLADVQVLTSRSDLPNPQVTSTSEAYDLFLGRDIPRATSLTGLGGPTGSGHVPIGRDENLERILQQRIYHLAAKKLTTFPR